MSSDLTTSDLDWKKQVATSFGRAAEFYENHAPVQRRVAESLIRWMLEKIDSRQIHDGLEIGCGTGFLTRHILESLDQTSWTISDISTRMIDVCRNHPQGVYQSKSDVDFVQADGESLGKANVGDRQFDLVCSNLTFQWFVDLPTALTDLMQRVKPGGWMIFSTLDTDNFAEVTRQFPCLRQRFNEPDPAWLIRETLESVVGTEVELSNLEFRDEHIDLASFLGSLKAIGASVSRNTIDSPEDTSDLRTALIKSRQSGLPVHSDYRILLVAARKKATA